MAVDSVNTSTSTGVDGNSITTAVSNDTLTTQDFLTLMLEELKLQDPTKPMDSQRMLDSQMQMTGIETNLATIDAMEKMSTAFNQSAFSSASNIIGKNIENGNINQAGVNSAFTVRSVESVDGQIMVTAQEILYLESQIQDSEGNGVIYDYTGKLYDAEGNETGNYVALVQPGQPITENGKPVILDENGDKLAEQNYDYSGMSVPVYSDQLTELPFESITKIF